MADLQIISIFTPDGLFSMVADHTNIVRLSGFGEVGQLARRLPGELQGLSIRPVENHPYANQIKAYYDGNIAALTSIPQSQSGSSFQEQVWRAIYRIPVGHTLTYKQLAVASGHPAAVRAVGTACGANKLILLIPCHRILKSGGGIGSYLYGPDLKESLLRREGAVP
jgi:O-6-methylguanine DNA methyltransferase